MLLEEALLLAPYARRPYYDDPQAMENYNVAKYIIAHTLGPLRTFTVVWADSGKPRYICSSIRGSISF